jgi:integrase
MPQEAELGNLTEGGTMPNIIKADPAAPDVTGMVVNQGGIDEADYQALKGHLRDYRYVLIAKLLRCTGVPISELLRLTPLHLEKSGPSYSLLIRRGKQSCKRDPSFDQVFLPPELGLELDGFIKGNGIKPGQYIFKGQKEGQHLCRRSVVHAFNEASERLGVRITPHSLRHLYSTSLIDKGMPTGVVAKLLGHADERTVLAWYYGLTREKRRLIGESIRP